MKLVEIMEHLVYIAVGWLLGLLSPRIVELIQKPFRRAELRRSLFIELDDLQRKFASVVYVLASDMGRLDRPLLQWIEPIMGNRKSYFSDEPIRDSIRELLKLSKEQLMALSQTRNRAGKARMLKKYTLPFLNSQITNLYIFTPEFQRLALDIGAQLAMINEEIDAAWFNYTKTFDSSTPSHALALENLQQSYQNLIVMYREAADTISLLLARKK